VAFIGAVLAASASGALFFLFKPTSAKPGERVTVRLGGTPASFTPSKRAKPLRRPIRVYLVPNDVAGDVHTRLDPRLRFIGQIVPDSNGRGIVTFTVPPLDTDDYAAAAWCPDCARFSAGRTFFVLGVGDDVMPRYRPLMKLHVEMPSAIEACPVTFPRGGKPRPSSERSPHWHGNGLVWTRLPLGGVFSVSANHTGWDDAPAGSIGTKWYWFAAQGFDLRLTGERLDAPSPPLLVHAVNDGQSSMWGGPTWATRISFPSEGCWRLAARVEDVTLSVVVKVVRG
jgi:hypothetical protein